MAAPRFQNQSARPIRILVVDDEPAVRLFMCRLLHESAFEVADATDAAEALRYLETHGDHVDLLVTDIMMPGMNGCDLGRAAVRRWPHVRVLFYSGYGAQNLIADGICTDDMPFLQKPFAPAQLEAKVAEVLDRPPYVFP